MDPATLSAAAIATLAFTKFLETGAGELSKKFTSVAIAKMDELRQKIWDKLRGNPKAEKVLAATEQGSKSDLDRVADYLQVVMGEEPEFAQEIQAIAQEIINISDIQGETWNVSGGEVNYNKENQAPVIQGGSGHSITFTYNPPPT